MAIRAYKRGKVLRPSSLAPSAPPSAPGQERRFDSRPVTSGLPWIVLKKSFWGDERKFLEPLMRFARGDLRDHIVSHKNDHGASYRCYGVLPSRSRLKINFCEIFGVVRFSTFATLSPDKQTFSVSGGMSQRCRYCCKSRKSNNPKNLAKVDLWTSLPLRRFSTPLRRRVIDFG
jgi:hypothetical protein